MHFLRFTKSSYLKPTLKLSALSVMVAALSGCGEDAKDCGGFWDKTFGRDACASSLVSNNTVSLAELGVKGIRFDESLTFLPDTQVEKDFYIDLENGFNAADYQIELAQKYDYISLIETKGVKRLAISTFGLAVNKSYPFRLKIYNKNSQKYTYLDSQFLVEAATLSESKQITVNNESITLSVGQDKVEIIAKKLKSPVVATLRVLQKTDGRVLSLSFDRNVNDDDIEVVWPSAKIIDPYGLYKKAAESLQTQDSQQAKKSLAVTKSKEFSESVLDLTPYDNDESLLNLSLGRVEDSFDYNMFGADEGRIFDKDAARTKPRMKFWSEKQPEQSIKIKDAARLTTSLNETGIEQLNGQEYEPVILVHGFNLEDSLGGGKGTWNKMPKLVMQTQIASGNTLVPFEFQWRTDANFKQVARDLSDAINVIYEHFGKKKVHIVAHSFGGVLTRTMLQGLGMDGTVDVSDKVASLTTLGTPHSGIFKEDTSVDTPNFSHLVPNGQDSLSFAGCRQISCFQAGEYVSYSDVEMAFQGLMGVDSEFGALTAQLDETRQRLPAIPIYVGIGLTSNRGNNGVVDNGDRLISFAGQRFSLYANTQSANDTVLLNQQKVGNATVTEVILGLPSFVRPNTNKSALTALPTDRPLGYLHSSRTGASNLNGADTVNGNGLEAAPNEDCDTTVTCSHAGYTLFSQIMGDVLNPAVTEYVTTEKLPAAPLIINPTLSFTAEQRALLNKILAEVKDGGYVSGNHVLWDAVSAEKRLSYHQDLNELFVDTPRVAALKQDYTTQIQALNDFLTKYMNNANRFIIWDLTTAKHFVSLVGNMTGAAVGVLKTAYPVATIAAGEGKELLEASEKTKRAYHLAKALMVSDKVLAFLNDCPLAASEYAEVVQKLSSADSGMPVSAENLTKAISIPMQCMVTVFDGVGYGNSTTKLTDLFTGTISVGNDTKPMPIMLALIDLTNIGISLAPSNPALERASGVLDVISAYMDSYLLGVQIKEHTDEVVSIEQAKIIVINDAFSKTLLQQRVSHILKARATGYYVADDIKITPQPEQGIIGRAVNFVVSSASGLLDKVTAVIWRFFSSAEGLINTIATAVNETASQIFESKGEYQARAEFRNAEGQVVATTAHTFSIKSLFDLGEDTETPLNDPTLENLYEVQKIGLDTSDGTLRLPLNVGEVDSTFPYIWIANSGEGTISKLATRDHSRKNPQTGEQELVKTGQELGRYRTGPGNGNPSRTTVDQEGNVWVGNRGQYNGSWGQTNNTITKVGLAEFGQCIDRNGNGVIDTSTGKNDVKAWTGSFGDGQGIANAQDECILQHVALQQNGVEVPTDIRMIAIDKDNNIFAGGHYRRSVFKVDGRTGQIIKAANTNGSFYGGLVDKEGNLWAASSYYHGSGIGRVLKVSGDLSASEVIDAGISVYGIALDKYGKIWVTHAYSTAFATFNPADVVGTRRTFYQEGRIGGLSCYSQGIAVDDNDNIFIAGSACQNDAIVGHYKQVINGNNTSTQFVANYRVSNGPTGVAVDGSGNVWSSDRDSNAVSRITLAVDPANAKVEKFLVGAGPYNYSDMTGRTVRNTTNRQGTWEAIFDGAIPDFEWKKLVWSLKKQLPEGTTVTAYAKTANAKVELGGKQYIEVQSNQTMVDMKGRFIKVKFSLTSANQESTPEITGIDLQ